MGLLTIAPIKHLNHRLRYTLNNMLRYHFGYTLVVYIALFTAHFENILSHHKSLTKIDFRSFTTFTRKIDFS